jgi:CRP/FNR family cyclic AMP-dependent transcriptional regulator
MTKHPHFLWADLFHRKRRNADLQKALRENILFSTLTKRQLNYASHFVYERVFEPGERIYRNAERGVGMYLIASGRVAIKTDHGEEEIFVTELGEGSFLGELALVDPNHLRTAHAVAIERCVLIGFFKHDLEEMMERNPAIGVKIFQQLSKVLGRRLLETTDLITQLKGKLNAFEANKETA